MSSPYTRPAIFKDNEPEKVTAVMKERYEKCSFCNTRLLYNHDLNIQTFEVIETSHCPGCGVSMAPKKHSLM